jgi:purine-nucleoside phosphorylase
MIADKLASSAADENTWPILAAKHHDAPSIFRPEALLREARRQKGLSTQAVPAVCLLDPDGDIVRNLKRSGTGRVHEGWACYHTELVAFDIDGNGEIGVVGCAVGASFAVLVAEQLFASGCQLLISITSAGQIADNGPTPYFILIDKAIRDEGTSYHYLPPTTFSDAPDAALVDRVREKLATEAGVTVLQGPSWTTDAPYRETEAAIENARRQGALAVEMEAAALYAFGKARQKAVVCLAYVTNTMAQSGADDFEKGELDGTVMAAKVAGLVAQAWASAKI